MILLKSCRFREQSEELLRSIDFSILLDFPIGGGELLGNRKSSIRGAWKIFLATMLTSCLKYLPTRVIYVEEIYFKKT